MISKTLVILSVLGVLAVSGASTVWMITSASNGNPLVAPTVDSTQELPRNSVGGYDLKFIANDPVPLGCTNLVGTSFEQGYLLQTYVSSGSVKTGGVVCIDIVLRNMNGSIITWGTSDKFSSIGYTLTDSTGRVVDEFYCHPTVPPPGQGPGQNVPRMFTYCAAIWETSIKDRAGVAPQPGTYHLSASATFPGLAGGSSATARSEVDLSVLP
jgi:hypothetical protein